MVFGRGAEELAYLRRHDVPPQVMPGVTAAFAAAAETGRSLTHRGSARRLCLSDGPRAH